MGGDRWRLVKEGGVKTASTFAVAAMGMLASMFLARGLSEAQLGFFVLILSVVQVGSMLADGGSGLAATRYIAATDSVTARLRVARTAWTARALLTAATLLLLFLAYPLLRRHLFDGEFPGALLAPLLLWIGLKSAFLMSPAIERGRRRWAHEGGLLVAEAVGLALVYAYCLWRGGAVESVLHGLVLLYASLAALSVGRMLFFSRQASQDRDGHGESGVSMGRLLAFGIPLMMNGSLFLALTWTDRILLGTMRSREELAFYYVAVGLSTAGRMLFSIPEQVFYSHLAQIKERDEDSLRRIYHRLMLLFGLLCLAFVVVAGAAGKLLIPLLYGSAYVASIWPFQLLLLVLLMRVISIPASLLLVVVLERTPETRNALAIAFVVNLILNLLLIPSMGITGAIVASFVGFVLTTLYLWGALSRAVALRPDARSLGVFVVLACGWIAIAKADQAGQLAPWIYWMFQFVLAAVLALLAWRSRGHFLSTLAVGARP